MTLELQPHDVVVGRPEMPFPSLLGKVEAEWALALIVIASKEAGVWAPVSCATFAALTFEWMKSGHNPLYNPLDGLYWLRGRGLVRVFDDAWIVCSERLLALLAGHPRTANVLMRRLAHEAGCARIPNPVSMDTVCELYEREAWT